MLWVDIAIYTSTVFGFIMALAYFVSMRIKDASIVDAAMTMGLAILAFALIKDGHSSMPQILISAMIMIWGYRLSAHIIMRNLGRKGEDWRYKAMRKGWGKDYWWRSLLQIFVFKFLIMLIMAAPLYVVAKASVDSIYMPYMSIGLSVWIIGFFFEVVGDMQLKKFISERKSKNKIMKTGLWKYTRHPNYFGELTQWWGIFFIVSGLPYGLFAVISPLLMTLLVLYFSGMPLLEKKYINNKEYQKYKKTTSGLFPLPPLE